MKIGAQRREVAQPSQLQCGWAERNFSTAETILLIWTTPCTKTGRGQGAPSSPIHDGSGLPDKVQAVIHCVKDQGPVPSHALWSCRPRPERAAACPRMVARRCGTMRAIQTTLPIKEQP